MRTVPENKFIQEFYNDKLKKYDSMKEVQMQKKKKSKIAKGYEATVSLNICYNLNAFVYFNLEYKF